MNRKTAIATILAAVCCRAAGADVVEYNDAQRPDFFDAVGGDSNVTTIDFTGFPDNTTVTDQYSNVGLTFVGLNFITGPYAPLGDEWGLRIFNGNDLHFDEPINWIAADFLGVMQIELYDDNELFFTSTLLGGSDLGQFGGVVSERSFDRVRLSNPLDYLTFLDDLHFGPPINVPGPGALLLLCSAAMVRRRRR